MTEICVFKNGRFPDDEESRTDAAEHADSFGRVLRYDREQAEIHIDGELYVTDLEIRIDLLKSDNAREWTEHILLRHIERVRALDSNLIITSMYAGREDGE